MAKPAITDAKAAAFWKDNFGDSEKVSNAKLAEKLADTFPRVGETLAFQRMTAYVIDSVDADGEVNQEEFNMFVQRFGPFDVACDKCHKSLFEDEDPNMLVCWFFGVEKRKNAERNLNVGGNYLLRFSEKYPTKLTMMHGAVKEEGKVVVGNRLLHNTPQGWSFEPQGGKKYDTLKQALKDDPARYKNPCVSSLYKQLKPGHKHTEEKHSGGGAYESFDDTPAPAHKGEAKKGGGAYEAFDDGEKPAPKAGGGHKGSYEAFDEGESSSEQPKKAEPKKGAYEAFEG